MKTSGGSGTIVTRHVPQRTCVACRRVRAKRELLRLVRTTSGEVEIDTTGRKEGRGAYICPARPCWEKALKGKQLEITLRTGISQANRDKLLKSAAELVEGVA
jgi:predicted RNA-binding protein YlxR (DUF448 family)